MHSKTEKLQNLYYLTNKIDDCQYNLMDHFGWNLNIENPYDLSGEEGLFAQFFQQVYYLSVEIRFHYDYKDYQEINGENYFSNKFKISFLTENSDKSKFVEIGRLANYLYCELEEFAKVFKIDLYEYDEDEGSFDYHLRETFNSVSEVISHLNRTYQL